MQNDFNDFHKILWVYRIFQSQQLTLLDFIGKLPEGKKKFLFLPEVQYRPQKKNCSLESNWDHKLLILVSYIEISPVVLEV